MSAMRIRDCEGDIWEQQPDGEWQELVSKSWLPTIEIVERVWGPVSEVEPIVIRKARVCLRKDCGGEVIEIRTWGGQVFRLHQHGREAKQ